MAGSNLRTVLVLKVCGARRDALVAVDASWLTQTEILF